ncbi:MAG: fructose-1,6-bisphosphatase [Halioglobus sp.]|jgi:fructose-1,6-bisphosphatase
MAMQAHELIKIQEQINEAVESENKSGKLKQFIYELTDGGIEEEDIDELVSFIQLYVQHSVAVILSVIEKAEEEGVRETIVPIIDLIKQYFAFKNDVISDDLGLYGLVDDAYLTHCLLAEVDRGYTEETGQAFLNVDMTMANEFIAALIGSPRIQFLDNMVSDAFSRENFQSSFQDLLNNEVDFSEVPDPIWENPDEFEEFLSLHIQKIGIKRDQ